MEGSQLFNGHTGVTQSDTMQSTVEWDSDGHVPRLMDLCRTLWPGAQHDKTVIKYLGNSMNRVFELIITDQISGGSSEFILRYPCEEARIRMNKESLSSILTRQVAMLCWLEKNTFLKAAKVLHYDATEDNAIRTPYMLQRKLPGKSLREVLTGPEELSLEKRLDLARALGRFFRTLRSITNSRAGAVVASGTHPELNNCYPYIAIQPFGASSDPAGLVDPSRLAEPSFDLALARSEPPWLKTKDVLVNAFSRRILQYEARGDAEQYGHAIGSLHSSRGIIERMVHLGMFEDDDDKEFSVSPPDLSPGSIMVDPSRAGDGMLTGLVGWDDPMFAPGFVSCVPPVWLWAPSTLDVRDDGLVVPPESTEYNLTEPETPDLARVKAAFDKEAGEFFVERAYSPGYAYARALLRWAQLEAWPPAEARQRDELLGECQAWVCSAESSEDNTPDDVDHGGSDTDTDTDTDDVSEAESEMDPAGQSYENLVAENQMLKKRIEELESKVSTAGRQATESKPTPGDGVPAYQRLPSPESALLTRASQALPREDLDIESLVPRIPRENMLRQFLRAFLGCYP